MNIGESIQHNRQSCYQSAQNASKAYLKEKNMAEPQSLSTREQIESLNQAVERSALCDKLYIMFMPVLEDY